LEILFSARTLEELALDPRGYDFGHPVDKGQLPVRRMGPHHIDNRGNSRGCLRQ